MAPRYNTLMLDTRTFKSIIEELIPFNRLLGLKLENFDMETGNVTTRLEMRPEYLGNARRAMPHGGLLSFLIDATAGASAALSLDDYSLIDRVATIDMRVDYLKPAQGEVLLTASEVMRPGNRIINVRSEIHDDAGTLVALGSNTFNVAR